jgi:hypothetical protein
MTELALYERLALERCRFEVAQLSAAVSLSPLMDDPAFAETFLILIQDINRDLSLVEQAARRHDRAPRQRVLKSARQP